MLKKRTPWNKGRKMSEAYRLKLSVAHKGKVLPAEQRAKISAALMGRVMSQESIRKCLESRKWYKPSEETKRKIGDANRGRKRSSEAREKIRRANLGKCLSAETRKKVALANLGKVKTEETKEKISRNRIGKGAGEANGSWRGGVSLEPYGPIWRERLKEAVRKRDKYICQICEMPEDKKSHCVHHKNLVKADCGMDNLVTLCVSCHSKLHNNKVFAGKHSRYLTIQ